MIRQDELRVKVKETEAAVSGFGGLSGLIKVAQVSGMLSELERRLGGMKRRRRGYCLSAKALDLMLLMCAGGECIDDLSMLRSDRGLKRLLGRAVMAPSTAHDFLRKFGKRELGALSEVRRGLLGKIAEVRAEKRATLDADASLFPSGVREAKMSYKGERGWMPMVAFWAELDVVVADEFRQGNASPAGGALRFLREAVAQLPECVEEIFVRSDSAWYQAAVMDECERQGYGFSITVGKDEAVNALIEAVGEEQWQEVNVPDDPSDTEERLREWAHETVHTLNGSKHAFRIILLRREPRQPDLFSGHYIYGAVITNMDKPLEQQLRWHRERCNCENHIKELKHGFGLRVLPSGSFEVNAVYFRIATLAYNLIAALKHLRLPESWRYLTIKTIRFRLFSIPAIITRHARQLWLHLPRGHPHLKILKTALA